MILNLLNFTIVIKKASEQKLLYDSIELKRKEDIIEKVKDKYGFQDFLVS